MIPGGYTRVFTLTFPERERQKPTKPERRARYKKNNENIPPPPTNRLHPLHFVEECPYAEQGNHQLQKSTSYNIHI